jgi:hypothetical protein
VILSINRSILEQGAPDRRQPGKARPVSARLYDHLMTASPPAAGPRPVSVDTLRALALMLRRELADIERRIAQAEAAERESAGAGR